MKIIESSIPQNFTDKLAPLGLEWLSVQTEPFYQILVTAISDFLALAKSKENKVALVINKPIRDEFLMAGIVEYFPGETEEMPGNWTYTMTFDKTDVEDCKVLTTDSVQFMNVMSTTGKRLVNAEFVPNFINDLVITGAECLLQWLDTNAKEGKEEVIELEGYFTSSVVVENGEKVKSIVPDGAMKRLIKDDGAVETNY